MKKVKLSECENRELTFLYGNRPVSIQYILRMIYRDKELPAISLILDQKQFDVAVADSLIQISNDVNKGINKKSYSLGNMDIVKVEVDITKDDLKVMDEEGYEFQIIKYTITL